MYQQLTIEIKISGCGVYLGEGAADDFVARGGVAALELAEAQAEGRVGKGVLERGHGQSRDHHARKQLGEHIDQGRLLLQEQIRLDLHLLHQSRRVCVLDDVRLGSGDHCGMLLVRRR
jgi:hypothetical protein